MPGELVGRLASKIRKVQEKSGQRYYHSNDIFREVGSESENEDSEAEVVNLTFRHFCCPKYIINKFSSPYLRSSIARDTTS